MQITNLSDFRMCVAATANPRIEIGRPMLCGVFLEPRKGRVTGTDGTRLVRSHCIEECDENDVIVHLEKITASGNKVDTNLPKAAETGVIDLAAGVIKTEAPSGRALPDTSFSVLEGKYPDCDPVIPAKGHKAVEAFTYNPLLLTGIVEAHNGTGYPGLRVTAPNGPDSAYLAELRGSDAEICFMPLRF